jgi:hypothetical protein
MSDGAKRKKKIDRLYYVQEWFWYGPLARWSIGIWLGNGVLTLRDWIWRARHDPR